MELMRLFTLHYMLINENDKAFEKYLLGCQTYNTLLKSTFNVAICLDWDLIFVTGFVFFRKEPTPKTIH